VYEDLGIAWLGRAERIVQGDELEGVVVKVEKAELDHWRSAVHLVGVSGTARRINRTDEVDLVLVHDLLSFQEKKLGLI
jgi:hypothetical protein